MSDLRIQHYAWKSRTRWWRAFWGRIRSAHLLQLDAANPDWREEQRRIVEAFHDHASFRGPLSLEQILDARRKLEITEERG